MTKAFKDEHTPIGELGISYFFSSQSSLNSNHPLTSGIGDGQNSGSIVISYLSRSVK